MANELVHKVLFIGKTKCHKKPKATQTLPQNSKSNIKWLEFALLFIMTRAIKTPASALTIELTLDSNPSGSINKPL